MTLGDYCYYWHNEKLFFLYKLFKLIIILELLLFFVFNESGHQCLNCQKVDLLGIMQCMIRIVISSITVITARASMITITVIKHYYNDHDLTMIITTIMIIIMIMMIITTRLRLGFFALGKTLMICLLRSDRLTNIYYNFETNIYILQLLDKKCITTFRHPYYHDIYIIYHYYISSSLQCSTQLTPTAMASLDWRNSDTTVSTGNFSDRIINIILYY